MILVTGATGKVGRHLVTGLTEEGVPVRALTRGPGDPGLPDRPHLDAAARPAQRLLQPFPGSTGTTRQEVNRPPVCRMCGPLLTLSSCRAYTAGLG